MLESKVSVSGEVNKLSRHFTSLLGCTYVWFGWNRLCFGISDV